MELEIKIISKKQAPYFYIQYIIVSITYIILFKFCVFYITYIYTIKYETKYYFSST